MYKRQDHEIEKFSKLNDDLKESSLRALRIVITTMPVMMFAMNVTTLAVVWYGGNIIIAGNMPVGDLTAFTTYIVQILMSLICLLYTSDAADEEDSVDLGGTRIIKKKTRKKKKKISNNISESYNYNNFSNNNVNLSHIQH